MTSKALALDPWFDVNPLLFVVCAATTSGLVGLTMGVIISFVIHYLSPTTTWVTENVHVLVDFANTWIFAEYNLTTPSMCLDSPVHSLVVTALPVNYMIYAIMYSIGGLMVMYAIINYQYTNVLAGQLQTVSSKYSRAKVRIRELTAELHEAYSIVRSNG